MKHLKNALINIGILAIFLLIIFTAGEIGSRFIFATTNQGLTAINMRIFEDSEIYGWGHKPGAIDYHGYGNPTPEIKINSFGFRGREITLEKPENTKRILALGDSFTFGMGVREEDIYTEILEKKLNASTPGGLNHEVINTGTIGYTIDNQYLLLKEKGLELDPDVVILAFFAGNDITELRRHKWETDERGIPYKLTDMEHYVDDENRLRYRGEDEPLSYFLHFLNKRWIILQKKLGIYRHPDDEPTLTWPAFLEPDDPHGDPRLPKFWNQYELLLAEMKNLLDEKGIKFVVVSIPMDVQVSKKYWGKHVQMYFDEEAYLKNRPQKKLENLTDKYSIDLIDLLPYFREADDENVWFYYEREDPHWTPEGHKFTADIIYKNLLP